jgi:hypothetical protein
VKLPLAHSGGSSSVSSGSGRVNLWGR